MRILSSPLVFNVSCMKALNRLRCMTRNKIVILVIVLLFMMIGIHRGYFWLTKNQIMGELITDVDTDEKVIALTFDDGPNPEITRQILTLLERYNAKATFFVVGEHADKYPEVLQKMSQSGCEIGNHSWSHEKMQLRSMSFLKKEITHTDSVIRAAGYSGDIPFRSPFGSRLFLLPYLLHRENRAHILWSVHLDDWKAISVNEMFEMFEEKVHPGAIVLLHDGTAESPVVRQNSVDVLEMILENYSKRGYSFVTVSELLAYQK